MARLGLVRGKRIQETGERLGLVGGKRIKETITTAPAGGRIMSSMAGHGGLAGMGGIAGQGGGLAG